MLYTMYCILLTFVRISTIALVARAGRRGVHAPAEHDYCVIVDQITAILYYAVLCDSLLQYITY